MLLVNFHFSSSVVFSVLCFQESLALHYGSDKEECPAQVSTVTPELVTPEDKGGEKWGAWHIESEVKLGDNCKYIISLTSLNGTGETNFSGILISQCTILLIIMTIIFNLWCCSLDCY